MASCQKDCWVVIATVLSGQKRRSGRVILKATYSLYNTQSPIYMATSKHIMDFMSLYLSDFLQIFNLTCL